MFIKWREECKPLTPEEREKIKHLIPAWVNQNKKPNPNHHKYYAYLAESKRIEGKPRQRIITYLGSIPIWAAREGYGDEWEDFWYKVHCSIMLFRPSYRIYSHVIDEVSRRVKCPTRYQMNDIVWGHFRAHPQRSKDYQAISHALDYAHEGDFSFIENVYPESDDVTTD